MSVLLQGPLLDLRRRLCMYAQPGGVIILSGFLEGQWPAIKAAYEAECEDFQIRQEGQAVVKLHIADEAVHGGFILALL